MVGLGTCMCYVCNINSGRSNNNHKKWSNHKNNVFIKIFRIWYVSVHMFCLQDSDASLCHKLVVLTQPHPEALKSIGHWASRPVMTLACAGVSIKLEIAHCMEVSTGKEIDRLV